jgi:hypothetical protein
VLARLVIPAVCLGFNGTDKPVTKLGILKPERVEEPNQLFIDLFFAQANARAESFGPKNGALHICAFS